VKKLIKRTLNRRTFKRSRVEQKQIEDESLQRRSNIQSRTKKNRRPKVPTTGKDYNILRTG
jgi:hypothetical protein